MTPATLTALAARLRDGQTVPTMEERAQAAAILEQVAGADAGCPVVAYQTRSLISARGLWREARWGEWQQLNPSYGRSPESIADKWEAQGGRSRSEVRRLVSQADHLAALTAQSGEGVALYQALMVARDHIDMGALKISHCNDYAQIKAAIAAYEAKRGGVR